MSVDSPSLIIAGAGGMGALFGAILKQGGLSVTLYDTDRAHVDAINDQGLRIVGYGGERQVAIPATHDIAGLMPVDLVLFQCKSHGTNAAAQALLPMVKQGAVCVSFQNGLGNEETIAEVVGEQHVLGGLTAMAGLRNGPGEVTDFSRVPSWIGEMNGGVSDRCIRIAAALTRAGLETHASSDIRKDIWKKLLGNIAMSAVSGTTNLTSAQCLALAPLKAICIRAMDEAHAVANSIGVALDREAALAGVEMISEPGGTGDNKSSLCVDLLNQRPTEVDFIYGSVIKLAHKNQVPVPTLETLAALVKGKESHYFANHSG